MKADRNAPDENATASPPSDAVPSTSRRRRRRRRRRPSPSPSRRRLLLLASAAAALALITIGALVFTGTLWPTRTAALRYPVQGVDVSAYQGTIDWDVLAAEDIDFAWIKATEGSGYQDPRFADNWAGAHATDLLVGAYHFLSVDSPGADQAANVVDTVPRNRGDLPVVIDVECYAEYCAAPPDAAAVREVLDPLLEAVEQHYGRPAVLYATRDWYERYLSDGYAENPIWFRSVATSPTLVDGRDWTFWQWSARERLDGYDGDEQLIDMNAFDGGRADLDELLLP
ncbi:glycoside hydrolase family 25 protein [Frigoribacterium faeni]|uniref:Lysozyme n=1 Tax=Frigoribacterium faeni TaxID=145483 RepID=A0A7W3JIZ9_9MICO|nr:GH25 family lysozyme [Frigoribacterium faeni]MBA8813685.1 lysozyme [Frigoribacterium faeni]